jgi:cellulose synthase (UDP-forming)
MARTPPIRGIRELTHFTAAQERLVRGLALVSLAYGLYWLWWRWTQTLNPDAMVFSVLLVSAETWGWFSAALFLFGAWKIPRREQLPAPRGKRVDVFITAYDEPLEVLRRTAMGARAIRYPHRTYFLDDGKRDELKHIADDLGIGYIRRVGNANAKAGNLNFALQVTDAEFILQLDADHYPLPNIIHDLLGYFTDPKVAFVQTPQEFYNTDSFTHVVNDDARELWEENRIFYSLLQPGKDAGNAAFFCGCGGMLRRAALDEIGGFSRQTIIEDMETSLILHSKGWKSVYHQAAVAFGLSPGSASAFHVQRQRWAQGSMQILRKLNPLFLPGLTPAQRAHYFAANLYPFDGLQKAMFYAAPVVFLLTGLVPVNADGGELLLRLLPYLLLSITAFEMLARGTGNLFISERYLMAKFFTYIVSLGALVRSRPLKFNVTPKGTSDVPFRAYAPQAVVLGVSVIALIWAPLAHRFGWVTFRTNNFALAFAASAVWAVWNIYFAAHVVRMSLRMRQQRSDHRFLENVAVRMRAVATEPQLEWLASLHNLNPMGLAFRSTTSFPEGTVLAFTLPLLSRPVCAHGRVVHVTTLHTPHGPVHQHGVQFENLSVEDRDAVELHCTQFAVPNWRRRYRQSLDLFARTNELFYNARTKRRNMVKLPARIWTGSNVSESESVGGLLEEVSTTGARLLLDDPVPPGSAIRFDVPGSTLKGEGTVVFSHAHESAECLRFSIGLSLTAAAAPSRRRWSLRSSRFPVAVLGSGANENA